MKKLVFAGLTLALLVGCSSTPLNDADAPSDAKAGEAVDSLSLDKLRSDSLLTQRSIYFDFDNSKLSAVSKNTLFNFLDKNRKKLSRYIIFGHTDTKGSSKYNMDLSIKRAESVKQALLNHGIAPDDISILGKGENELAIDTPDNTKHPANRRAEVKILN